MKNNITLIEIFQSFISEDEILAVYREFGYEESSRKFKGLDLYKFLIIAAINEYKSYRYGADLMERDGLTPLIIPLFLKNLIVSIIEFLKDYLKLLFLNVTVLSEEFLN